MLSIDMDTCIHHSRMHDAELELIGYQFLVDIFSAVRSEADCDY
ncbi:MAG: hypothetical protein U5K84_04070 [Alkalibacterium sp.]|nr:hypothetical protein [Alkalibacterium sp.]